MAYALDITLALGGGYPSLTDLRAQLVDTTGSNVGGAVSTGFVNLGTGNYLWHYAAFPDAHRGAVLFYSNAASSTILAVAAINPEEAERIDAAVSSRSTYAGADTAGTTTLLSRITALLQTKAEADTAHGLLATAADLATLTGYVDAEVAAIKAKTDNLPTDPADQSQVEAAITAAQSALAAAIAALNNLSSAQAQTAAAAALAAYDGPTHAEMTAELADLQTHGDDEWGGGGGGACPTAEEIATLLAGARLEWRSPVLTSGDVEIIRGDDYDDDDGRALRWTYTDTVIDYTGATVVLAIEREGEATLEFEGTVTKDGDDLVEILVELTAADSEAIAALMPWALQIHVTLDPSGRVITPIKGALTAEDWIGS